MPSWIFILLAHWNTSPLVDMLLHADKLFRFWTNQSDLNAACLAEKQQIPILWSGLTRPGLEPTIYRTRDGHDPLHKWRRKQYKDFVISRSRYYNLPQVFVMSVFPLLCNKGLPHIDHGGYMSPVDLGLILLPDTKQSSKHRVQLLWRGDLKDE
jgi:hypothetical protein